MEGGEGVGTRMDTQHASRLRRNHLRREVEEGAVQREEDGDLHDGREATRQGVHFRLLKVMAHKTMHRGRGETWIRHYVGGEVWQWPPDT